jgi:hypothetical protein
LCRFELSNTDLAAQLAMLFLILLQLSFNKLISAIAHCCSFLSLQSIKDFFSREYANMIHPAGLAAYAAGLLCVFIWAYRKVSQTYRALQDECPWSLEKKTRELDFRARDAYYALAAKQGDKTELFHLLVQRAISAVKQYSGIKDEMLHFEQIKHLLTPSIVNRELCNLHLIVDELQNINLDGDKLTPGWGMWATLILKCKQYKDRIFTAGCIRVLATRYIVHTVRCPVASYRKAAICGF